MSRKRHKPEEIVSKLRQVDVLVSQGQSVADAIRTIGITEVDHRRELETALQHQAAARLIGLPATGSRGVRPRHGGLAQQAKPSGGAADPQLTFTPDHPVRADHRAHGSNRLRTWRQPIILPEEAGFDINVLPKRNGSTVVKAPGTFNYICRYHPNMKSQIVVQP